MALETGAGAVLEVDDTTLDDELCGLEDIAATDDMTLAEDEATSLETAVLEIEALDTAALEITEEITEEVLSVGNVAAEEMLATDEESAVFSLGSVEATQALSAVAVNIMAKGFTVNNGL